MHTLSVAVLVVGTGALSSAPMEGASRSDTTIVFARLDETQPENYELWTMDGHGRNQESLTFNDVADHDPAWSPDGTKIAWVHFESQFNVGAADVWVMNADGSNTHRLTNHHASIRHPSWSPDGSTIVYTSDYSVFVIDADGTDDHAISPAGAFDFDPDWSPDGALITFVNDGDLFTMWPDGSHRHRLALTPRVSEQSPSWSPDGRSIAYTGYDQRTGWHVYLIRRDGTGRSLLVEESSLYPDWFPDGSRVAFHACVRGDCGLYEIRVNGHALKRLGRIRGSSDIQPDIWPR